MASSTTFHREAYPPLSSSVVPAFEPRFLKARTYTPIGRSSRIKREKRPRRPRRRARRTITESIRETNARLGDIDLSSVILQALDGRLDLHSRGRLAGFDENRCYEDFNLAASRSSSEIGKRWIDTELPRTCYRCSTFSTGYLARGMFKCRNNIRRVHCQPRVIS